MLSRSTCVILKCIRYIYRRVQLISKVPQNQVHQAKLSTKSFSNFSNKAWHTFYVEQLDGFNHDISTNSPYVLMERILYSFSPHEHIAPVLWILFVQCALRVHRKSFRNQKNSQLPSKHSLKYEFSLSLPAFELLSLVNQSVNANKSFTHFVTYFLSIIETKKRIFGNFDIIYSLQCINLESHW